MYNKLLEAPTPYIWYLGVFMLINSMFGDPLNSLDLICSLHLIVMDFWFESMFVKYKVKDISLFL